MRIPRTPPKLSDIQSLGIEKVIRITSVARDAMYKGRYVHWDKLRHLPKPAEMADLTHEEWWFSLKHIRRSLMRPLSLKDKVGKPFQLAMPDPIPERLHKLDMGIGGSQLSGPSLEHEVTPSLSSMRDHYIVRSLTEEAITSSQLEGAATTRVVAKQMLRSGRSPRDNSERMIFNNYRVMEEIRERKNDPLTPELIFELHRILTRDTLDNLGGADAVGRLRSSEEKIQVVDIEGEILHTPPDAETLGERMALMCDFANNKNSSQFIHPVIRAIVLHFWLAYDHPFVDGNGRCARALFYWSMLNSGYFLCEFLSISHIIKQAKVKYGRAFLYCETDENDLTYFVLYHLDVLQRAVEELHQYIDRKTQENRQVEQLIRLSANFNLRQRTLLGHALRHPDALYTIAEHQASHNVTYQTARTDLQSLTRLGLLTESKRGREFFFRPVADLRVRLQGGGEGVTG